jgi:hypothetical protein
MELGERVAIFLARPIYRIFLKRPIWWFLSSVKTYFFAEMSVQLGNLERQSQIEDSKLEQRWTALEQRLHGLEAANAAQWDAIEQLLLALFQQPELRTLDPEWKDGPAGETPLIDTADANRMHAANSVR